MSPAPNPQTPPTPGAKGSLGKWVAGHKWEAALGGGGIAVTLYLAYRARQNSAASGSSTSSTSAPADSTALPASYYPATDGGGDGFASELSSQITQLQSELTAAGGSGGVTSVPSTAPQGSFVAGGHLYQPLANTTQAAEVTAGGGTLYGQPSPGVAVALPASGGPQGIPLFVQAQ